MKITKEIKLALLGIVAILMFVLGYKYLRGTGMFSTSKILMAEYDNVQGLTPASYVQLQGFNVGTVKNIELSPKNAGKVLVTMAINKDLNLPIDTKAKIVSLDLLGTKAVNLVKGSDKNFVKENDMIGGNIELGTIESLGASAGPAIDNAKVTLASLDNTIHSVNNILDASTQNSLKYSINSLSSTMKELNQFATELNTQRSKISSLINNLNTASTTINSFAGNLNNNNATINNVLKNAETTTKNLSKLELQTTVDELKSTLNNLETTLNKVNNGTGSLALLMNDDKLYKNLKNTLSTANNLLYDINARPSRYINVNLIGRKQKNDCPPQVAPNTND